MTDNAIKLTERRVRINLGAAGDYVGERLELSNGDWNGRIRITGVLAPARCLPNVVRGFRPGEFIDASAGQLGYAPGPGYSTYLVALQVQVNRYMGSHSGYTTSPHNWVSDAVCRAVRAVMLAEVRRLATGHWLLCPADYDV